ncbi:MAG: imidazole glycerol phosphate synthase subunit HisH [Gammaproteobacteria bacterium]|nr:imidazole glycerol phosphate synthase subunit HisH [Gammaproteobacteria bacterium]
MRKQTVAIIDSGGANLASVRFALSRLSVPTRLVSKAEELLSAERAILPGVGAAADAMQRLRDHGLVDALRDYQRPLLGICLGLQLLYESSSEGGVECLGRFAGGVDAFDRDVMAGLSVPHMGWNRLAIEKPHAMLTRISNDDWFYFVHGYRAPVGSATLASCRHGENFTAVAAHDNVFACQFHPERSARAGRRILENFLEWSP